ncbi:MAG TPA: hypothetical protein VE093_37635 [Polyangiaceae bacterium]|nr:hypothetical protein [Polyangiaceae bacterium]
MDTSAIARDRAAAAAVYSTAAAYTQSSAGPALVLENVASGLNV